MSKDKVTVGVRIEVAKACAEGKISQTEAAQRLGLDRTTVREWVLRYKASGILAFQTHEHNKVYSYELKLQAVIEYLSGNGSLKEISAKYALRSDRTLRNWIKVYNSGKDFGHNMSGGCRMKEGLETTLKERIAIVKDCLKNGSNYGETAIKFNVSYQQTYTWVKKFKEFGEVGLEDRRGKRSLVIRL